MVLRCYGWVDQEEASFVKVRSEAIRRVKEAFDEAGIVMPEPVYFGGTVDRAVSSADLAGDIRALGRSAEALDTREACGKRLAELARPGDRIVVMGARDDTLSDFALQLLTAVDRR